MSIYANNDFSSQEVSSFKCLFPSSAASRLTRKTARTTTALTAVSTRHMKDVREGGRRR